MTLKRTDNLTFNIRRGTVPELTESQYQSLMADAPTEVSDAAAEYLTTHGYAAEEE
jgi:hypothetical protein